MEIAIYLARFWGALFLILGALSMGAGLLKKIIKYTDDKTITISTGYITFLLGLITVVLHNVWVADWRLAITILGWGTVLKGIEKIAFPDRINKAAQLFKSHAALWGGVIALIGAWFLWMGIR